MVRLVKFGDKFHHEVRSRSRGLSMIEQSGVSRCDVCTFQGETLLKSGDRLMGSKQYKEQGTTPDRKVLEVSAIRRKLDFSVIKELNSYLQK